ncbi:LptA/OstA family protein [Treponema primitia]|uniref:LptA/OstA family protein n=1 Tax=Treponema primitia TaxID=88058 RepID=UPI00025556F7|nr:LptA/OstA family protein [Treponema primitia]
MSIKFAAPVLVTAALILSAGSPAGADTFSFKADRMSGGRAAGKEITMLTGNAEVRSDNLVLKANRIELQGDDNQFVDCSGDVWGMEEEKNILFQTDRLRYDRKLKIARLEGNSTLEDKENEIVAKGRFIEYDDQNEITVFQISVRLFKDELVCRSEYAVYRRQAKLLDLSGFPVVFKKSDEFRADRIRVDLDTDDVTMEGSVSGSIKEKEKEEEEEEAKTEESAPELESEPVPILVEE